MRGRPSTYTQAKADHICEQLRTSSRGIRQICQDKEVQASMSMVFRWLDANEKFREQYARAKRKQADFLADEMIDIAAEEEDVQRARLMIDTRKWIASKLKPKKYGDKVGVTGPDGESAPTLQIVIGASTTSSAS